MRYLRFFILNLSLGLAVLTFTGCATAPYVPTVKPGISMPVVYHRVEKGETLWRISRAYNVDLDEIVSINRVSDATSIEIGQLIFIPHRQKQQHVSYGESDDFNWPLKGKVISVFGSTYENRLNKGINIQPNASSDVSASRSGKIVFCADNFEGYGKTIIIDHGDGFFTVYARNAQVFVKAGENVTRGVIIAKAGSYGKDKNTYLHFQIRKGDVAKNPYFYLPH